MTVVTEESLIDILDMARHSPPQSNGIKKQLLSMLDCDNCPNLTYVWNLAELLSRREQITVYEMNNIWRALSEMQKDNKCELSDFAD